MTALEKPAPISVEDFLEGEVLSPVRHEYIGGTVHAMAGGKASHNKIALDTLVSLSRQLGGSPCEPYGSDMLLKLKLAEETRFYYPDGLIVCHPIDPNATYVEDPTVVIEVLSESTRRTDLGEKREAYLNLESLEVLLFVSQDEPNVACYRRKEDGSFSQTHLAGLGETVPLPEIGAALKLEDIYRRIEFAAE